MALSQKITLVCVCALAFGFASTAKAQDYGIATWYCTPGYPDCEDVDGPTLVPAAAVTATATCNNGLDLGQEMILGLKSGTQCKNPVVAKLTSGISSFERIEEVGCQVVYYEVDQVFVQGTVFASATELYSGSGTSDCEGGVSDPPPWETGC